MTQDIVTEGSAVSPVDEQKSVLTVLEDLYPLYLQDCDVTFFYETKFHLDIISNFIANINGGSEPSPILVNIFNLIVKSISME